MGFTYRRLDGRRHRFLRGETLIVHTSARGIGFAVRYLLEDAARHGVDEELVAALNSIEDLRLHPLEPPSSNAM